MNPSQEPDTPSQDHGINIHRGTAGEISCEPIGEAAGIFRLLSALEKNEKRNRMVWRRDRRLDTGHDGYLAEDLLRMYGPYIHSFDHTDLSPREVNLLETCLDLMLKAHSDTRLLNFLQQLFEKCPDAELRYVPESDVDWEDGEKPGWSLGVHGCAGEQRTTETTLRQCLSVFMNMSQPVTEA
jgi:hypothetical protein